MTEAAASNPPARHGPSRLRSDSWLTRRATKGDRRAFEAIYQRYHQELYRFCVALVGNPQDAQEALQNTMVKVLRALPGEQRHINLKPWLYRIARNEAVETVRRRRDSVELEPERERTGVEITQTAEARERLRGLIADLEELPERQRGALVMRELAGLEFDEIAAAFETSAAVARQTVYEARLSLRQMEEGREMSCETVMRALSDADGRTTRRREVRAHLRSCPDCRAFRDGIAERRANLTAISPLPAAASLGLLHGLLTGQASAAVTGGAAAGGAATAGAGATTGSLAGTAGAGAGKLIATSAIAKSVAAVAVVAAVGVTAADRGGLIDVPLVGGSKSTKQTSAPGAPPQERGTTGREAASSPAGAGGAGDRLRRRKRSTATKAREARRRRSASERSRGHRGGRQAHGKSRARSHGRPASLPQASRHGQQTASAHKSPNANPSPATGPPPAKSKSPAAPPSAPAEPAAPSAPAKAAPPEPSPAPAAPGETGAGEAPAHGAGGAAPETGGP